MLEVVRSFLSDVIKGGTATKLYLVYQEISNYLRTFGRDLTMGEVL